MKFRITVKRLGEAVGKSWTEDYEEDTADPLKWATETIARFNDTLRPFESARELLGVETTEGNNDALHDWDKSVKQMSMRNKGGVYDGMYCRKCGITGKRFGLSSYVKIDSKFRRKVFARCDTSAVEMERAGR